jgi:hypothetical protein
MTVVFSIDLGHPQIQYQGCPLILYLSVDFTELQILGKGYRWKRPQRCFHCDGTRIWGHGYVERFFDEVPDRLWMKRWRCPECGTVYTVRPHTHWRGFWASQATILSSLVTKASDHRWLSMVTRERQQYWWRGLRIQQLFTSQQADLTSLIKTHIIAATHSLTHREMRILRDDTHRIFAFTPPLRGP